MVVRDQERRGRGARDGEEARRLLRSGKKGAAAREGLVADPTNAAALEAIDSALFAVCLEDAAPDDFNAVNRVMLHGDARNRWFDKSFQLIVDLEIIIRGNHCTHFRSRGSFVLTRRTGGNMCLIM